MSAWKSPQSIYHIGHPEAKQILSVPVQVQEKVDGSFFAFGKFPLVQNVDGVLAEVPNTLVLMARSKGALIYPEAPPKMFEPAIAAVRSREHLLKPYWQYRGETLAKPKHNALSYDRTPKDNIILFDILTDNEVYLPYEDLQAEANRLGLEVVPRLYHGVVKTADELRQFLQTDSILGGQKIEGVVLKPLEPLYARDKKMLFAKFVSEHFKEVHKQTWNYDNPSNKDIILRIAETFSSPARFQKALIHLREAGEIEGTVRDIGKLVKEVPADIKKECEEEIKDMLFKYAWPHISRTVVRSIPSWYKELLLTESFEETSTPAAE